MDRRPDHGSDAANRPAPPPPEPRQRWRIAFSRGAVDPDQVGRVALEAWQETLVRSGLPMVGVDGPDGRARIAFGAPLPAAACGERELLETWLLERVPLWRLRESIEPNLPPAHLWVDAEDVWLGTPALAGQVAAADWRIELDGGDGAPGGPQRVADAATALTAARSIPRVRLKGTTEKRYDLRPLLIAITVDPAAAAGPAIAILARTRFDPELGAGRPEEVVSALGDACGLPLTIRTMTRTRLILADELRRGPAT